MALLTPGYTVTDVFPPRFTVRPSFRIRRFRPRAPGSPPTGRGAGQPRRQRREKRKELGEETGGDGQEREGGCVGVLRARLRAGRAGAALTVEAVGLKGSALGQHRQQRLLAEQQLADDTITAPKAAAAPGPQPQLEAAQDNRVPAWARGSADAGPGSAPPNPLAGSPARAAHLLSRISGSVMRVLVMWLCTPLRPCQPGPAPAPPATVS